MLLNNLQEYKNEQLEFKEMTIVDKVMMCKLLSFSAKITEAYDEMNLAKVYKITQ